MDIKTREAMLHLYNTPSASLRTVGELLGVSAKTVRRTLETLPAWKPKDPAKAMTAQEVIMALKCEKFTMTEVAVQYHVTRGKVRSTVKRFRAQEESLDFAYGLKSRNNTIREEFKAGTVKDLCKHWNLSERTIRRIVSTKE